jgi:hypothetical protein
MQAVLTLHTHVVNKAFPGMKKLHEMHVMADQHGMESVFCN